MEMQFVLFMVVKFVKLQHRSAMVSTTRCVIDFLREKLTIFPRQNIRFLRREQKRENLKKPGEHGEHREHQ
jgi:hypothetical protein